MALNSNIYPTPTIAKSLPVAGNTVGSINATSGLAVRECGNPMSNIRTTEFTFTNYSLAITKTGTTNVYGSAKIYTFPEGFILHLGSVANLTIAGDGTNIVATAPLVTALGSVAAANDATLSSTEADYIASTTSTLAASAGTMYNAATVAPASFAGNAGTAKTININCAGDNTASASATANGTITLNGTIVVTWLPLGDNAS